MDREDDELCIPGELLTDVRQDFAEYYAKATTADAMLLYGVVLAQAALVVGYNALVTHRNSEVRAQLERKCVEAEQVFSRFRKQVRASTSLQRVSDGHRLFLERVALTVNVAEI